MELSEEMQEALRILREDGQIKSYREMTESHKAMVARMDEMETKNSERDAQWEARFKENAGPGKEGAESGGGTEGGGEGDGKTPVGSGVPSGVPTPPPVKETEPTPVEERRRKRWHESDVYSRD